MTRSFKIKQEGRWISVSEEDFNRHQAGQVALGHIVAADATPIQIAGNAIAAGARLGKALLRGERIRLSEPEIAARRAICLPCENWDASAYRGLGKCRRCGCSGFKLDLATEKCPLGKWPAVAQPPPPADIPPA